MRALTADEVTEQLIAIRLKYAPLIEEQKQNHARAMALREELLGLVGRDSFVAERQDANGNGPYVPAIPLDHFSRYREALQDDCFELFYEFMGLEVPDWVVRRRRGREGK